MGARIANVQAKEIMAQRGVLSLQVTVTAEDGSVGIATPESGVSTGTFEAKFLLDGGDRYNGLGVQKAARAVNTEIQPALLGMDVTAQAAIDGTMNELDGTPDKARLGANSIVGVSLAALKCAAAGSGLSVYRYIGGVGARTLPIPIYGIGTGGRYRDPGTSRWFKPSYEFCAYGAGGYKESIEWSWRCAQEARTLIKGDFDAAFEQVDVIVGPVSPSTAFRIGEKVDDPLQMYLSDVFTVSANLAGLPGVSIPCGFANQMPVGLQILGRPLDDAAPLRMADAFQRRTDFHLQRPPDPR